MNDSLGQIIFAFLVVPLVRSVFFFFKASRLAKERDELREKLRQRSVKNLVPYHDTKLRLDACMEEGRVATVKAFKSAVVFLIFGLVVSYLWG